MEERSKIIDEEENLRGAASSLSRQVVNSSIANPLFNSTAKTPTNMGMFQTV
jgi:hypothetical protein